MADDAPEGSGKWGEQMVDDRFAKFQQVSGVREEVVSKFKTMIDKDPEALVSALRSMMHSSGAKPPSD